MGRVGGRRVTGRKGVSYIRVPVELPQALGLERDERGSDRLTDRKVGRVDFPELAASAGRLLRRMFQRPVHERAVAGPGTVWYMNGDIDTFGRHRRIEDIGICLGHLIKYGFIHSEVFCQDVLWRVCHPVVHVEGRPDFVKVCLVKHQEKLVLILEALDGVRNTFWKVPDVAKVQLLDLVPAVLVHGRDEDGAGVDDAPFRHAVPMHLAESSAFQVLLGGRYIVALGEVGHHLEASAASCGTERVVLAEIYLLPHPARRKAPHFGI